MQSVVQLVNRLQGAATLLGDNAGTADSSLPSLWSMLPSIVVIGGQVRALGRGRGEGEGTWERAWGRAVRRAPSAAPPFFLLLLPSYAPATRWAALSRLAHARSNRLARRTGSSPHHRG